MVDEKTGALYGHIILGSSTTFLVYITPAIAVFEDIRQSLTAVVTIPTCPPSASSLDQGTQPHNSFFDNKLPCDFVGWGGCNEVFDVRNLTGWLDHVERVHLGTNLPRKVMCWFCARQFDAASSNIPQLRDNFRRRIRHISNHIVNEKKGEDDIRPDWHYAEHLHKHGFISDQIYAQAMEWCDFVQYPTGRITGIHHPSFVPPSRQTQRDEQQQQVIVDGDKERRRHRTHRHRHKKSDISSI